MRVNGKVVENPDLWIDFDRDQIEFDNKPLQKSAKIYLLLNKPPGYITTLKDPEGRPTVYDLIREIDTFVSPVGRLDLETSGLLILTNDTQLGERLTNPDHKVAKTYRVECADVLDDASLQRLRGGVVLNDGPTMPAQVKRIRDPDNHTQLEIAITEGRNRQVRRMIEAVDSKVLALTRTKIGDIAIGNLEPGKWRNLTAAELATLSPRNNRSIANLCR